MAGGQIIPVQGLPQNPLGAAGKFLQDHLEAARAALAQGEDLVLTFPPAGHEHDEWRRALVQGLAREAAPHLRVNGVIGRDAGGDGSVAQIAGWLLAQPGITGQIVAVDGAQPVNPAQLVR
ncbi:Rossmann fold domain-containing protein [Paraurantiacibacter namhicola]|uniref:Short chain dehydrogenase-like proteobacteria domain-containing protein n=1 Tax=Paraurantiacibacter namhicola TaxID=645517 RepID=A0A1C7D7G6_9SPHN|nr:hypothetical protein [Paraurantiacibacter namhicola]ANU07420.1 hypothetical protein A6F65_01112 [Paraurantiacibacter namhicola]